MVVEEREYVVPLRRGFRETPRYRRTKKAVTTLRAFLMRHCKAEQLRIGQHLNSALWARGIKNPPARVKVHVWIEEKDGIRSVRAELAGKEFLESVRPIEKHEEESGLAGKLKQALGGKSDATKDETSASERGAEVPKQNEAPKQNNSQ